MERNGLTPHQGSSRLDSREHLLTDGAATQWHSPSRECCSRHPWRCSRTGHVQHSGTEQPQPQPAAAPPPQIRARRTDGSAHAHPPPAGPRCSHVAPRAAPSPRGGPAEPGGLREWRRRAVLPRPLRRRAARGGGRCAAGGVRAVSLRGRPGRGAPRPRGLLGATQRCQPPLRARDGRQPRRQRPRADPQETAGSARQEAGKLPTPHFFCLALSAESNSRRFVLRSALFFFFFFFACCAGLFRFSSTFPHVCLFRAPGGRVG